MVFDGQGWGTVLALALSGGWSRVGNSFVGVVADVQPPTAPAGLRWGLCGAVLRRQGHLAFRSPAFLFPAGPVWLHAGATERGRGRAYLLFLLLLTVKAVLHGMAPVVVHMERENKRPCLCLLQLTKTKATALES